MIDAPPHLFDQFQSIYNTKPELIVNCPGRVNLIGEHIDYHGYGVFPMAIKASTIILASRNDDNCIRIRNSDPKYDAWESPIPCPWNGATPPKWFDYVLCGWKGIIDHLKIEHFGFNFLVSGTIPPSSGLSSSSSLVCASALSVLSLHSPTPFSIIPRADFAHLCATCEPLIGTLSGGMDQAAEVLASDGSALKIDFNPLRFKNIELPEKAVFVVAHSMTELNKGATSHYNERVIEGRIVAQILKKHFSIDSPTFRLKEVHQLSNNTFDQLLSLVETLIPEEMNKKQVEELIGKDKLEECLTDNTRHFEHFKLRSRARHVFSEAQRVDQFELACADKNIERMGELMNESHESCAKDYECSCPELDKICSEFQSAGALGARLTGAGWGGCAVILCSADNMQDALQLPLLFESKPANGIDVEFL